MKTKILLFLTIAPLFLTGCVSTTYTKTVTVTKDANGKIIGSVESESIMQPNESGWPVKFEYLKGVQSHEAK